MARLFSYVVHHDLGIAPFAHGRMCTLAKCKFGRNGRKNIVELAEVGDWIVGTGGADPTMSAGHGRLIYAMRVDDVPPLAAYCQAYYPKRIDAEPETIYGDRRALISRHFYYFGRDAIKIPAQFLNCPLEKRGPGFRRDFSEQFIERFVSWLEGSFRKGVHGLPCDPRPDFPAPNCRPRAKRNRPTGC